LVVEVGAWHDRRWSYAYSFHHCAISLCASRQLVVGHHHQRAAFVHFVDNARGRLALGFSITQEDVFDSSLQELLECLHFGYQTLQQNELFAIAFEKRVLAERQGHEPLVSRVNVVSVRGWTRFERASSQLTKGHLDRMCLAHFHVNECHVAGEAHVAFLQIATVNAVVEARHEHKCGQTRLGHSHEAHERAEKAVEKEVEMVEQVVELGIAHLKRVGRAVRQEHVAKVPDDQLLEQVDGQNGQEDLGKLFGDEIELDQETDDDYEDEHALEAEQIAPEQVADGIAAVVQRVGR